MKLTEIITDVGRPVAFYPGLRKITGSTTATLFLCQLIYWNGKQADPNGWIYKTSDEIEEETGLSYDEQVTARKQLVKLGFIEEQYKRLDHKMTFRIMANAIDEEWRNLDNGIPESRNTALGKAESPQSLNSITETTAENTDIDDDDSAITKLSRKFEVASQITMWDGEKWLKACQDMYHGGVTPELLARVVFEMRNPPKGTRKLTVAGPWSCAKIAIARAAEIRAAGGETKTIEETGGGFFG